jgi:O-antigen ligase
MPKLYRLDKQLAILLMLSFFLPPRVQVLVLIPVSVFLALRDVVISKHVDKRRLALGIFLGSLYLLYLAYLPFTEQSYISDLRFHLESKAGLLLFPLAIACMMRETIETILRQLHWFIAGCMLSCIIGNLVYIGQSFPFTNARFLNHVNYRLGLERITGIHPTYMGMYLCFAVAILLFYDNISLRLKQWQTGILLFLLFVLLLAIFPKTPLVALLLVLVYYLILHIHDRRKWRAPLIAFAASLLFGLAIPFSSQRAAELKGLLPRESVETPIDNSIDMRQIIWRMDMHMLRKHWIGGVGPGRIRTELEHLYFALSTMAGVPMAYYDTHNEYLNIWISFGVIGLLLFLGILAVQFFKAIRNRAHLYICLLVLLSICCMTENVLANQRGIIFCAFFSSLLFFATDYDDRKRRSTGLPS